MQVGSLTVCVPVVPDATGAKAKPDRLNGETTQKPRVRPLKEQIEELVVEAVQK